MSTQSSPVRPHENPGVAGMRNTNRFSTRQLVICALLCAISMLLTFVEFPLLPGTPWLKYDASAMPAIIAGLAYGPVSGVAVGVVAAVGHGILFADFSGAVMNIIVVTAFVIPCSLIYRRRRTLGTEVLGLIAGSLCLVAAAVVGNLIITPAWLGVPMDAVVAMIVPILIPFNALKAVLNSVLSSVIYRAVKPLFAKEGAMAHG